MANDGEVTITLPGLQDIIKIPIIESTELKRQRIQRMRAANSPLPENMLWMPEVINKLDDAQDLIFTALSLGKLFAPKLLSRLLPYVGWALVANDVLNLGTSVLGLATTGSRFPKRDILESTKATKYGRAGRISAASAFLSKRFQWLPFVVQGGQVLYNFTGYGLQLGTVMGAISDTLWAGMEAQQGTKIRVIPPPPDDFLMKAARYVQNNWIMPYVAPVLTWDEIKTIVVANEYAVTELEAQAQYSMSDSRLSAYATKPMIAWNIANSDSREALLQEGYNGDEVVARPGLYTWGGESWAPATANSIAANPFLDQLFAQKAPPSADASMIQQVHERSTDTIFDVYSGTEQSIAPLNTPWERMLSRCFHDNVFPPWEVEPCDINAPGELLKVPKARNCRWFDWVWSPKYVDKPMRMPRLYPPLFASHDWQLAWFLTLALSIKCRRSYQFGVWTAGRFPGETRFDGTVGVIGPLEPFSYLAVASILVWGNVWSRNLSQVETERLKLEMIRWCVRDDLTEYPRITGDAVDRLTLAAIRQALPAVGELPGNAEFAWDQDMPYAPTAPA